MTSPLHKIGSLWLRAFEPVVSGAEGSRATARALRAARIATYPEWYLAMSYLSAFSGAIAVGALSWLTLALTDAFARFPIGRPVLAIALGAFTFLMVRLAFLTYPRMRAAARARRIDAEMPTVVTLCYALAQGNLGPLEIIRTVAAERNAYGEAAVEFGIVVRNVEWLGLDIVAALENAAETTPSSRLKSFFHGLVTMLNSGAEAKDYFMHQAKHELAEADLSLEKDLEQASMLAEIYVSGLLVLPLLLMVVISGLAPLAAGQTALIPFIVFGFIPLGTIIYIVLVETLLPPETLTVPKSDAQPFADFGLASVPSVHSLLPPPWETSWPENLPEAESEAAAHDARLLRRTLVAQRMRQKARSIWAHFTARMLARPTDALQFSGIMGLAVLIAGGLVIWTRQISGNDLAIVATGFIVAAAVAAAIPVSVFHEIRVRRARKVEETVPENLAKLAGFNERGIGLLQSFEILGRSATGPLAKEFRAVERDVTWNGSLANALRRLRARVNTLRMTKLSILLERASAATGNLRDVLDIAASDSTKRESIRSSRRQAMMSYVVVIYIVFAVFLYVLYMVATLFYGAGGFGNAATKSGALEVGLDAGTARVLFAQAAVIQGICCGLVAGRLGEGHALSGLKHAAALGAIAYAVFLVGVLS